VKGFGQGDEVVEQVGNTGGLRVRRDSFLFFVPGAADKYFPELCIYVFGAV
jgi:hypothetical protein